jgi:phenylacetic acid degradation operon negative regulatory protein
MPHGALRPRAGSSAKALLLTILGELVLPREGSAWTQSLVQALRVLGVEDKNARQALSRLATQGLIVGAREGRRVRWRLTPAGRQLLSDGTKRIYGFGEPDAAWDAHWLVVLCSVPEEQRARRHQLRTRLAFAGFGFLGPGVAITPHVDREPLANAILKDLDLVDNAVVLIAEAGDLVPAHELLHRSWDLAALGDAYDDFVRRFARRRPEAARAQFAALVSLVHAWRRFPFIDPEVPDALLPVGWPGHRAKALFDDRHRRWAPGANAYFDRLERDLD